MDRTRVPGQRALARLLGTYLRPYAGQVGVVVVLLIIQATGTLYLPHINAGIIDRGIIAGNIAYIWRAGGLMLCVAFVTCPVSVMAVRVASRVSTRVGADIRAAVYERVQGFSAREMNRFGTPSLITRNSNDVQQVQIFLQAALALLVTAVVISLGGVIMAFKESAALFPLIVVAVLVMALVVGAMLRAVIPLFRSVQAKIDRIGRVLREQITGIRVIRAFGRTPSEERRFADANADLTGTALRAIRIFAIAMPALTFVLNLSMVGVFWLGSPLVSEGKLPLGNMLAFTTYIMFMLIAVMTAITVIALIPRAVASAQRIGEVLAMAPAIADPPGPALPAPASGMVEFRDVTFGYPGSDRPVLTDLAFVLRPGQTSAIIGGTGSGKTTLLNLIVRFFDPTRGVVLVGETDVRDQAAGRLRSAIGLVPQAAFLFRGTVASNLRFAAPDATDAQLWHALDVAQALDFVASMPGQLEAPIDQGGTNVSGGQRQRLCIARALARRPRLYLFDDCFSALDAMTDARLRHALRAETRDAAVVIAAQRVSTIMDADQIIVLDAGTIAGIGTHQELLAGCDLYQEIVSSQLGEEVAA
jgi:ABC-type multidrug transport system fused ATPase/permease subunit